MGEDQRKIHELKVRLEEKRNALRDGGFREETHMNKPAYQRIIPRRELRGHFGKVYSLHFAGPDRADWLVSASQDGKLIVWNANTTNKIHAIPLRSCWVMSSAFEQAENNLVACGGLENICYIYNLQQLDTAGPSGGPSAQRPYKELEGHDGYLSSCRFIGRDRIITSSGDSSCRYWDIPQGVCLNYFKEHMGDVMSVSPHPHNPNVFVSGSVDLECKLWDIRAAKSQPQMKMGGIKNMHSNRYAGFYARGAEEEIEGDPCGSQMTYSGHESDVNSVVFFPDGNSFGTGSDDASCRMFDLRCHQEVNSFRHQRILCGITSVVFSSSGRVLFGGYDDCSCVGWDTLANPSADAKEATPVVTLRKHEGRVSCVNVHSQGQALATGSWDNLIRIWA